jgi:cob(I)alamin adenosyltransferase
MGSRQPKEQELALQEIARFMESQISYITGGLRPLDSFIASHELNADLHLLRATVREAEVNATAARDHLELEAKDTSEQMLYMLEKSAVALNILSDWVFAFGWLYSTEETGALVKNLRWVPMSDEELRLLND